MSDIQQLQAAISARWTGDPGEKARPYIGQFYETTRVGSKIVARLVGKHGTYTVSIDAGSGGVVSACSCYIGKGGGCHHCEALAHTFLRGPTLFREVQPIALEAVQNPSELPAYLQGVTLEKLLADLKANGITQTAFADAVGMNARHLTAVKTSELRNQFYNELGALKLACLWMLEHFGKPKA